MASEQIDNLTRQKLGQVFEMSTDSVLDFSSAPSTSFVQASLGFHLYERYGGSERRR